MRPLAAFELNFGRKTSLGRDGNVTVSLRPAPCAQCALSRCYNSRNGRDLTERDRSVRTCQESLKILHDLRYRDVEIAARYGVGHQYINKVRNGLKKGSAEMRVALDADCEDAIARDAEHRMQVLDRREEERLQRRLMEQERQEVARQEAERERQIRIAEQERRDAEPSYPRNYAVPSSRQIVPVPEPAKKSIEQRKQEYMAHALPKRGEPMRPTLYNLLARGLSALVSKSALESAPYAGSRSATPAPPAAPPAPTSSSGKARAPEPIMSQDAPPAPAPDMSIGFSPDFRNGSDLPW